MKRERPSPALMRMALRVAKLRGRSKVQHALVLADAMEEEGWREGDVPTGRKGRERFLVHEIDAQGVGTSALRGTITVPTEEWLSNVRWFRDRTVSALRKADPGHGLPPNASSLYAHFHVNVDVLRRLLKRDWVNRPIVVQDDGNGNYDVYTRRGRYLLWLEREESD